MLKGPIITFVYPPGSRREELRRGVMSGIRGGDVDARLLVGMHAFGTNRSITSLAVSGLLSAEARGVAPDPRGEDMNGQGVYMTCMEGTAMVFSTRGLPWWLREVGARNNKVVFIGTYSENWSDILTLSRRRGEGAWPRSRVPHGTQAARIADGKRFVHYPGRLRQEVCIMDEHLSCSVILGYGILDYSNASREGVSTDKLVLEETFVPASDE